MTRRALYEGDTATPWVTSDDREHQQLQERWRRSNSPPPVVRPQLVGAGLSAAYTYAFDDSTSARPAHVGATEHLAVQESYGASIAVYLFTAEHAAVACTGTTTGDFQAEAIVGDSTSGFIGSASPHGRK